MSYVTHIHAVEHGWLMVGYHDDPRIAAEQEAEAAAAVESGEWYGYAVDSYRVFRADTSEWSWN